MRLFEISQREVRNLGRQTQRWANKRVNAPLSGQGWDEDLDEIIGPHLIKKGLRQLGTGAYAAVYGRPDSDRVVKVSTRADKCWLSYATWAMGQTNNPHVPDIYHLESYSITSRSMRRKSGMKSVPIFFAVMERLDPMDEQGRITKVDPILVAYIVQNEGVGISDEEFQAVFKVKPHTDEADEKLERLAEEGRRHPIMKLFKQVEHKWKQCGNDIHEGNLMIRPATGDVVLTDPLSKRYW